MVSVAIANNNRHALKLLKKKYKVSKMDDVIGKLLEQHESDAYKAGIMLADLEQQTETEIVDDDD